MGSIVGLVVVVDGVVDVRLAASSRSCDSIASLSFGFMTTNDVSGVTRPYLSKIYISVSITSLISRNARIWWPRSIVNHNSGLVLEEEQSVLFVR